MSNHCETTRASAPPTPLEDVLAYHRDLARAIARLDDPPTRDLIEDVLTQVVALHEAVRRLAATEDGR